MGDCGGDWMHILEILLQYLSHIIGSINAICYFAWYSKRSKSQVQIIKMEGAKINHKHK